MKRTPAADEVTRFKFGLTIYKFMWVMHKSIQRITKLKPTLDCYTIRVEETQPLINNDTVTNFKSLTLLVFKKVVSCS